jgi:hypothetical protein
MRPSVTPIHDKYIHLTKAEINGGGGGQFNAGEFPGAAENYQFLMRTQLPEISWLVGNIRKTVNEE